MLGAALLTSGLALAGPSLAEACGGMFRAAQTAPEQRPSLSREKVLLIHDAERGRQHFVREVAFRRATEPFGFVVPTPARPEVEAVEHTPFSILRRSFPFVAPELNTEGGGGGGSGYGRGSGGGVTVLEQKAVGSFTAFVLAASDAQALAKWLADNELVSSPEADRWLAHYVELDFFYVAMRYDPKPAPAQEKAPPVPSYVPPAPVSEQLEPVTAETIRISFDTPLPYYPYLEPETPEGMPHREGSQIAPRAEPRLMELWYVGSEAVMPIAVHEHEGARQWVRPLAEGAGAEDARQLLGELLEHEPKLAPLLPEGALIVQTFQDQKRVRDGFADIVFAPREPHTFSDAQRAALAPLLALLDPELIVAKASPTPEQEGEQ